MKNCLSAVTFRQSVEIIDGKLRHPWCNAMVHRKKNSSCNPPKTAAGAGIQIFRRPAIEHQSFDIHVICWHGTKLIQAKSRDVAVFWDFDKLDASVARPPLRVTQGII